LFFASVNVDYRGNQQTLKKMKEREWIGSINHNPQSWQFEPAEMKYWSHFD